MRDRVDVVVGVVVVADADGEPPRLIGKTLWMSLLLLLLWAWERRRGGWVDVPAVLKG